MSSRGSLQCSVESWQGAALRDLQALGAAAVRAVAVLGGLSAVLAMQGQANADLSAKNRELDEERAKVEKRFELAQKAIALFHTGVVQRPGAGCERR